MEMVICTIPGAGIRRGKHHPSSLACTMASTAAFSPCFAHLQAAAAGSGPMACSTPSGNARSASARTCRDSLWLAAGDVLRLALGKPLAQAPTTDTGLLRKLRLRREHTRRLELAGLAHPDDALRDPFSHPPIHRRPERFHASILSPSVLLDNYIISGKPLHAHCGRWFFPPTSAPAFRSRLRRRRLLRPLARKLQLLSRPGDIIQRRQNIALRGGVDEQ